jgi:blue copper oxidase
MRRHNCTLMAAICLTLMPIVSPAQQSKTRPYQELHIPQLLKGTHFDLNLHKTQKSFWSGAVTTTYAYNDEGFWGPTVELNAGDNVQLNVHNSLEEPTTTHWHGLHLPAEMDGGPQQLILPGATWSPQFKVMNNAGLYWYHPHAHETTQKQLTYGAGGLIIIRDAAEKALNLPRTYGVDDIPLALTSRRFYRNDQFSFEGDNDKYGDYLLANGTLDPRKSVPAQFVRLRILNAEIERGYNLGFRDNRTFYQIGTDGGLVDKPVPLKRLMLMVGERAEILVDLSEDNPGTGVDLMAYNANHPFGYPGGEPGTTRPNGSYLNNIDFQILHMEVGPRTANPVLTLPLQLAHNSYPSSASATVRRKIDITADNPGQPFWFDYKPYLMHQPSQIVRLGDTELWTITNGRIFGHSFHMHDVQFKIVERSSGAPAAYEEGWKDTVYIPRNESVTVVARFDDFASDTDAYMYHCHMANHEDGGLMAEFLVVKDPAAAIKFREKLSHPVTVAMSTSLNRIAGAKGADLTWQEAQSNELQHLATANKPVILTFVDKNCPCSRDAALYFNRVQKALGGRATVVGVINGNGAEAAKWRAASGAHFAVSLDPLLKSAQAFNVDRSVMTLLLGKDGKILKTWAGYSKDMLVDLSKSAAELTGGSAPTIDTAGAPAVLVSGCSLGVKSGTK